MKKNLIYTSFVLIFSHLLLEAAELSEKFWPSFKTEVIRPIISNDFRPEWYVRDGIVISWWIKVNCDDLVWITTYIMLATVALKYSERLFIICTVFLCYHILDYIMLWWNWKSSHWVYWILNVLIIFSVILVISPIKNKQAVIKNMNQ